MTPEIAILQPQFTNLAQFLSDVKNSSSMTDSQSTQLTQLLVNLRCYFAAFESTYGITDSWAQLLDIVTAGHELQMNYLQSKIAVLAEKSTRLDGEVSHGPGNDADLIGYLCSHLHLRDGIETRKSLVRELQTKIASSEPLVAAVSHSFRLSPGLTAQTLIPALADKFRLSEHAKLRSTVEQQQATIEKLREQAASPRDAKRLHRCKVQVRELSSALDSLYGKFERQSTEIHEAAQARAVLSAAVSNLLQLSQAHESYSSAIAPDAIAVLRQIALPEISAICRSDSLDFLHKARRIVDVVNPWLSLDSHPHVVNLRSIVCGLFRFLNSLSSQRDFRALIGDPSFDECKGFMIQQVMALQTFLREKAIGYVEDSCLFEELLKKRDMGDLIRAIDEFAPKSPEDNELFLALMQAVAANDILRKFAADSLDTLAKQRREIQQLHAQHAEMVRQEEAAAHNQVLVDAVVAVRNRLRMAILKDEAAIRPILDGLKEVNAVILEDRDYVEALEQEIAELRKAIGDREAVMQTYVDKADEANAEVQRAEEKVASAERTAAAQREAANAEVRRLEDEVRSQAAELEEGRRVADQLISEKERVAGDLVELQAIARTTIAELVGAFDGTRADCLRLLEIKDHRIQELESAASYIKSRAAEQKAKFRSSLFIERNERNALEIQLHEHASQEPPESGIMKGEIEKLTAHIEGLKGRLVAKKRDHSEQLAQQEAVFNAKLTKAEADAQQKLEQAAKEVQAFLANVNRLFTPTFEGSLPPTFTGIDALLRKVKAELDRYPALLKAKGQLDELRSMVKGTGDIVTEIGKLTKLSDQRGEIARLQEDVNRFTCWVERLFALYGRGEVAAPADLPAMKSALEAQLRRTTGEESRTNIRPDEPPNSGGSFPGFIFDE
jgi:hypothetical protein